MNATKDNRNSKTVWRPWMNIDDLRERSLSAWEDFKINKHTKPLMMKSTSWDTYEELVRVYGYSHEDACDSVITNLMTP